MKTRFFPSAVLRAWLSLLAILVAACSPTSTQSQATAPTPATFSINATSTPAADLTAISSPTVQMVATSRGPKLEATDPKTVSMAGGGLQFVEFFEFW